MQLENEVEKVRSLENIAKLFLFVWKGYFRYFLCLFYKKRAFLSYIGSKQSLKMNSWHLKPFTNYLSFLFLRSLCWWTPGISKLTRILLVPFLGGKKKNVNFSCMLAMKTKQKRGLISLSMKKQKKKSLTSFSTKPKNLNAHLEVELNQFH